MRHADSINSHDQSTGATLPAVVVENLLAAVIVIAGDHSDLAEKRQALLIKLAEFVQADGGYWAWGRGWPDTSTVAPVAILDFGFTDRQRAAMIELGLDEHTEQEFRLPIRARMGNALRSTYIRRDIISDEAWEKFPFVRQHLERAGWGTWMHSVQYSDHDTWSNIFLVRNFGRQEFERKEAAVLDVVLNGIRWLHSTAEELVAPETFVGLSPRQRSVMLMLLDGLARKTIARQLDITEDTVGDHIKSIYTHFGVNSAGELSAQFLRSR